MSENVQVQDYTSHNCSGKAGTETEEATMAHSSQVDSCYRGRCGALRRYLEQHFVTWARIATETRQVPHGLRRTGNTARIKKAFEHNLLSPVYTRSCNDTCVNNYITTIYTKCEWEYATC